MKQEFAALVTQCSLQGENDKNMRIETIRRSRWTLITLVAATLLSLCLVQCKSSPSVVGTEHCGGYTCTTNSNCMSGSVVPLCGDAVTASCQSVVHECVWKIKIDSNCPCIERDVRLCTLSGGGAGVQICTANAGRTATSWATCTATPACSP
jgi:hypothetical protein